MPHNVPVPAPRSRRATSYAALALTALLSPLATGCGVLSDDSEAAAPPPEKTLSFAYQALGGDDRLDQTLTITNQGADPVTFEADLTALDEAGEPLDGVTVSTVYGSDRGRLVVVPGRDLDIVRFEGRGVADVADVQVEVREATAVPFPAVTAPVDAAPVDRRGREVDVTSDLTAVELRNPNDAAVEVRTVYLVFDEPVAGRPQQVVAVAEIAPRTPVPPGGEATVRPTGRALAVLRAYAGVNPSSVQAHFVPVQGAGDSATGQTS